MSSKFYLIVIFSFFTSIFAAAGQDVLSGKVVDATHGVAVEGASISWGNGQGTVSDSNGNFTLSSIQTGDTLLVSKVGYEEMQLPLAGNLNFVNIRLTPSVTLLKEVIVAGSNLDRKLIDEPGAIGVITPRELQRDNDLVITPGLNRIPGVYMHSGALNTNRITIRGIGSRSLFSTNKIKAYINEIPLTTGDGETTIEDIDLQLVDRVEVIKGPNSSIFGAGLGGTINFTTVDSPYRNTSAQLGYSRGSYGLNRLTLKTQHGDDHKNFSLIYNKTHQDGYRENNRYDRESITLLGKIFMNKGNVLNIFGNFISLKAFIPSSLDSATFASNPSAAAFTWQQAMGFEDYNKSNFGISYNLHINDYWSNETSFFTNFRNAFEVRPFNILTESTQALGARTKTTFNGKLANKPLQWVFGTEYFIDWYDWQTLENDENAVGSVLSNNMETRFYLNLFSQLDYELFNNTFVSVGLNLNKTNYELTDLFADDNIDQSGDYSFNPILSPRLAILHKLKENKSVYVNVSHGFSPPTLAETLTPDGLINPDIKPESGYNFELGSRGSLLQDRLEYDISIYTMRIENLLVARRVGDDQFIGVNAGKTTHDGAEVQVKYALIAKSTHSLRGFVNLSVTDYKFDDFVDGENNFSGNELTGTPANIINYGLDYEMKNGLYAHINSQFVDRVPVNDANTVYASSYQVANVKAGYKKLFYNRLELNAYAGINNIFDEKYASMILVNASSFGGRAPRYFYPGLPRNFYGGIFLGYKLKAD
ncbi:TonB-dependent receptor [Fulvivirgaceae bacterium BMA12]|uniref:TonB-dependent receptor n=1 Tax=Agaribacillus aureus TaxID=3051825 RepID=A0ABT8L773_9BACT|nr:TonB-dependent receptor [Fulvivirgaceae bacterium BMA12]